MGHPYPVLQKETDLQKTLVVKGPNSWLLTSLPTSLPTFLLIYQIFVSTICLPTPTPTLHSFKKVGSHHSRCRVHMFLKAGKRLCSVKTSTLCWCPQKKVECFPKTHRPPSFQVCLFRGKLDVSFRHGMYPDYSRSILLKASTIWTWIILLPPTSYSKVQAKIPIWPYRCICYII